MEIMVSRLCLDGGGAVFFGGLLPHRGLACRRLAGELEVVRLGLFELLGRTFHILLVAIGLRLDVAVVLLRLLPVGARRLESVRVVRVRIRVRVRVRRRLESVRVRVGVGVRVRVRVGVKVRVGVGVRVRVWARVKARGWGKGSPSCRKSR